MSSSFISRLLKEVLNQRKRFLAISFSSLILYIFLIFYGIFSEMLSPFLDTNLNSILWMILSGIIILLIGSLVISGMSGLCISKSSESSTKVFFNSSKQHWKSNFLIIALIWALGIIIISASIQIPRLLLPILGMDFAVALIVLIQMFGLLGVMSFISLASFIHLKNSNSFSSKISSSIKIVKKNYLKISWILLLFAVFSQIPALLENLGAEIRIFVELIFSIFVFPLFVLLMTKSAEMLKENDI